MYNSGSRAVGSRTSVTRGGAVVGVVAEVAVLGTGVVGAGVVGAAVVGAGVLCVGADVGHVPDVPCVGQAVQISVLPPCINSLHCSCAADEPPLLPPSVVGNVHLHSNCLPDPAKCTIIPTPTAMAIAKNVKINAFGVEMYIPPDRLSLPLPLKDSSVYF